MRKLQHVQDSREEFEFMLPAGMHQAGPGERGGAVYALRPARGRDADTRASTMQP